MINPELHQECTCRNHPLLGAPIRQRVSAPAALAAIGGKWKFDHPNVLAGGITETLRGDFDGLCPAFA